MLNIKSIIMMGALFSAAAPIAQAAAERTFSYPDEGETIKYFGDSKAQTYDIAIKLTNPALVGKTVTGVSVALYEDATISTPQGWLSSDLLLDSKKRNAPDIEVVEAELSDRNVLTARFAKPYVVPPEGVYVGYSITIDKATTFGDQNPNPLAACDSPDGAFIHSTRTDRKWTSFASYNVASCMEVSIEGDFAEYAINITDVSTLRTDGKTDIVEIPLTVCNTGATAISSLEFSYAFGEEPASVATYNFDKPMSAKYCGESKIMLPLPVYDKSAELRLAVTKVNGEANSLSDSFATGKYVVMNFVPTMRPLMEEYTGLWCGYCPRGLVAMEIMSSLYPDDFVCVSYHNGDYIWYISDYPSHAEGLPGAVMNRSIMTDPYYDSTNTRFGIEDLWLTLKEEVAVADIDVDIAWDSAESSRLKFTSRVKFAEEVNGDDYRVQYILLGDGFKSEFVYNQNGTVNKQESLILSQNNYYSGEAPLDDSPYWLPIVNGGSTVDDLVFNDVAMALTEPTAALPDKVNVNEEYSHEYILDYSEVSSVLRPGKNYLPASGTLRCVALLLTADGQFVNCNKSKGFADLSAVRVINAENTRPVSSEWYDLQGRRLTPPSNGMTIRLDRLSDGSIRSVKQIER